MTKINRIISVGLTAFLLLVSTFSTAAEGVAAWRDGFNVRLGAMWSDNSTIVRLNSPVAPGLDIEENLLLDETISTGRIGLGWRFKDRHQFDLEIYQFHRDGDKAAVSDFDFTTGNGRFVEVKTNAGLETKLNFDVYDASYSYSFIMDSKHHLLATAGLYWMDIGLEIKGSGTGEIYVDGVLLTASGDFSESVSVGAPMPLLGMHYNYAINPQWIVNLNARYFAVTVNPYSGSISYLDLATAYYFENFYVGGGFTWVEVDVDVIKDDWKGGITWNFTGPNLFIGAHF